MFDRLAHMLTTEFIQVFRDRRMKLVVGVLTAIQMLVFGLAGGDKSTQERDIETARRLARTL